MADSRLRYFNRRVVKDLSSMPEKVQDVFKYALFVADRGGKHPKAKPMKGLGPGVMEVAERYDKSAYRLVYTTQDPEFVYLISCFQKKSVKGKKTPDHEIDIIRECLKLLKGAYG